MVDSYYTIKDLAIESIKEKASKFIAYSFPVADEIRFKEKLNDIKKQNPGANHFCYAFKIGITKTHIRSNDDGEPNGTAGKPILNQLEVNDLKNSAIVVVRFFGGTLLGTSGLIQAYGTAAKLSLKKAEIIKEFVVSTYRITFGFDIINEIHKLLKENDIKITQKETNNLACTYQLVIKNSIVEKFKKQIIQLRSKQVKLEEL